PNRANSFFRWRGAPVCVVDGSEGAISVMQIANWHPIEVKIMRWRSVAKHESRDNEAQLDELGSDPGQVGSDSAGQSGDTQGLSQIADAANVSVEELADTDQAYEAE